MGLWILLKAGILPPFLLSKNQLPTILSMGDRMSDLPFKSMDEVKSFAAEMKSQLDAEGYRALLFLLGLLDNQGVSRVVEIDGKSIEIDCYIAPIVEELNRRGFKTLSCCSGLDEEHENVDYKSDVGYISFVFDVKLYDYLQNKLGNSYVVKQSEAYLTPSIYVEVSGINDTEKKEKWVKLWETLRLFDSV